MNGDQPDPKNQPTASGTDTADKARQDFERGVISRGEAAPADSAGRLPPGATHEITGYDSEGKPILKRRRFSTY
jgi:hypothetical protein